MCLFPKVNRTQVLPQWKCCVSCMGGLLDMKCVHVQRGNRTFDHDDCVGVRKILWTREDFDTERTKKTDRIFTRRYSTLGIVIQLLHQTARSWKVVKSLSCRRLVKVKKCRNSDDSVPWDGSVRDSQKPEADRNEDDSMPRFAKAEKREETKMIWCP